MSRVPSKAPRSLPRRALRWSLAAVVLAAGGVVSAELSSTTAQAVGADRPTANAAVDLAVLVTPRDMHATSTEVRFLSVEPRGTTEKFSAPVPHALHGVVRGDVLRGRSAVAVVADLAGVAKGDYASALYVVDATRGVRELARGVYHASRPLASVDGNVYIEAGRSGAEPTRFDPRALREDAISIDAVSPDSGARRTLYTWEGYTLHLAGEHDRELIVYRVGRGGADLVAIERVSGKSRLIATIPPFARDFSVDHASGAVLFSNRDPSDSHVWTVERVDLSTGKGERLTQARDVSPVPFSIGQDRYIVAPPGGGFTFFSRASGREGWLVPGGSGTDVIEARSADGAWLLVSHRGGSGLEQLAVRVGQTTGQPDKGVVTVRLTTGPENVRPIGFFGAVDGGRR